ncbi:transcriptional regulator, LysR family [Serratia sp. AS12]|uniref:LysR family transcriptional regulator n=1 Tax=Serratia TaxID=613 RepID=UPI00020E9F7B|nr:MULTISPECIES: LysR family transcriptional regulator [Serratia]AEF46338.1 transcriptional regulator, LysR family [Serratia plymuthica AS9]AEF51290.1 transcriptional regulator, LysR family [Serratia sp. AS12]AEG28998.1 transcriptional regulator, LysR family [Serratia sp. AS13]UTN95058.1 LysR family transcriptional regulator [Serratia plymuthica]
MSTGFTAESLRGITHFVITAKSNSFTEAAEQLGITKSAVGKSVARLEERLGTRLFHRSTRKLSLTSDGEAYLTSCLSALEILDSAENTLSRRQDNPAGTVRIDMPASFGRNLMMPVLLDITRRFPALRLALTFNDRLIDPVEEGVDLVLRLGELQSTDELIARRLSRQRLLLCATPAYLEQHGIPTDTEMLKKHCCIMGYRRGAPLAWRFKPADEREIRFISAAAHQISDGDAMLMACLAGAGIAQFPESMVNNHLDAGTLVTLMADHTPVPVELNVVWPRTRHLIPKVRLIVDELLRKAAEGYFGPLK